MQTIGPGSGSRICTPSSTTTPAWLYAEIRTDEKANTAIDVLHNAVAWFAGHGVVVQRVLSDNGSAYKSYAWRDACTELNIIPKRTRPYRPQTNGKIERFGFPLKS